jgi:hypothetical protein
MSRRFWVTGLVVLLVLGLAVVFWSEIADGFFEPLARGLWLLLRVTVLGADQGTLWTLGLMAAVLVLAIRLTQGLSADPAPAPEPPGAPAEVAQWKNLAGMLAAGDGMDRTLRRELLWLLVSLYTLKHRVPPGFEVADAFRNRRIPLPEEVDRQLFGPPPPKARFPLSLWASPRPWSRKARAAQGTRDLALVLSYLEKTLEAHDV